MATASFSIHNGLLYQTSMSHLMALEYWVMEPCSTITDSQAHGFQNRSPNQSRTVAAYIWGPQWVSKGVLFLSDNSSVVEILWLGTSRALTMKSLVCYPCVIAAHQSFCFSASPVSEKCKPIANSHAFRFSASGN